MTRMQFKIKWESDKQGGGINFDDIAECAKEWGLYKTPRTAPIMDVRYDVLRAAGTDDCEAYNPKGEGE